MGSPAASRPFSVRALFLALLLAGSGAALPALAAEDLRLQVARQWAEKGDYDKAIQELRLFLNEHPEAAEVYARIGTLQLRQEKVTLAEQSFRTALSKDPGLAEAKDGLARIKAIAAGPGAAPSLPPAGKGAAAPVPRSASRPAAQAPAALEGDAPDDVAAQGAPQGIYALVEFQDALRLYREKKPDAALAALKRTLAKSPGHPGAYYLGGVIRYEKGELAKAAYNFKRSFAYPERGYNAHFYLARIYQKQDRDAEAITSFRTYLQATKSETGRKQAETFLAQLNAPASGASQAPAPGAEKGAAPESPAAGGPQAGGGRASAAGTQAAAAGGHGDGAHPAAGAPSGAGPAAKQVHGHGDAAISSRGGDAHAPEDAHAPKDGQASDHGQGATGDPGGTAAHGAQAAHGEAAHGAAGHGHGDNDAHAGREAPAAPAPPPGPKVLSKDGFLPFVVADTAGPAGKLLADAYEAFKREQYEKAADILKEVIRRYGGSPDAEAATLDLAAVYVRLGLHDNARDRILDYLSKAKEPARYRDLAFYLEGLMHLGKKDGEKAERALLKVKPGAPGGPTREELDWRLAQAGELMKDPKKWAAYLEKAIASATDLLRKAHLSQRLGWLHARHGRVAPALEHYRKSLDPCGKGSATGDSEADSARAAHCAESRLRIADLEFRRKDWKAAMAAYRAFTEAHPGHPEAAWVQYQVANVHQATRNLESALNEYKKVIDNYPDSYWATQAKWKREDAIWRKEYEEVLD